ncbi:MAG: DUF554 domain-containing protein [Lachnospiraceae bacterium]|nr:DUF554 domain-containing protein [Lachnospiraceae bacterium]
MIGVLVNVVAILVGAIIGVLFNKVLSEKITSAVMMSLGIVTFIIGIKTALKIQNELLLTLSVAIGTIIDIDKYVNDLGEFFKKSFAKNANDSRFAEAFASASILFAVGAMSVLGSIEAGLNHDYSVLFLKSTLDFCAALIYGSTLGIGVAFSSFTILVFEGLIALFAGSLTFLAKDELLMNEFSAVGNLLVMMIGLNLMGVTKVKLANMLPSIVMVVVLYSFIK